MPIAASKDGTIVATGKGIDAYAWIVAKQRLKLESVGMTHSKGAIRPKLAKQLGLKPRAPYAHYIAAVEAKLAELAHEIAAENKQN